MTIRKFSRSHN